MLGLGMPTISQAQQKATLTTISNPGRMYPNCELEDCRAQLTQQFGEEKADAMIKLSNQKEWPEAMNTTEERMEPAAEAVFKKYKVRPVVNLNGYHYIVAVNSADNKGIDPKFLSESGTFYMLVDKTGLKSPVAPMLVKKKSAAAAPAKAKKTK